MDGLSIATVWFEIRSKGVVVEGGIFCRREYEDCRVLERVDCVMGRWSDVEGQCFCTCRIMTPRRLALALSGTQ